MSEYYKIIVKNFTYQDNVALIRWVRTRNDIKLISSSFDTDDDSILVQATVEVLNELQQFRWFVSYISIFNQMLELEKD